MVDTRASREPGELLNRAITAEPSRPLVTFYDDATGERIELSAKTFGNWVAKTANLLVDGLDAEPGERVVLALPAHWQTAVWLFASWSAGLITEIVAAPLPRAAPAPPPALAVVAEADLAKADFPGARELIGLSLHALGAPLRHRPAGVVDYSAQVRSYGDRFTPYSPVDPDAPALTIPNGAADTTLTGRELVERGRSAAAEWHLDARSRVLSDMPFSTFPGLLAGLIAPISSGGSVVICRNLNETTIDRRVSAEQVTAVAGVPGWGDPSGSVRRLA